MPVIQPTGEATGFIPAPDNKGKPITVIGTAAIRETFDAKCIEQSLNSRGAPGVTDLVLNPDAHCGYKNHVKADAKSKLLGRHAVTDASVHDSQKLAQLVATEDGEVYAGRAYRSAEAEAMLAQKQVTSQIHERAYRNRPLTEEQKASNRKKSKIRARIEHVFGFMSQSMKGFYLRYIGRRRNAAAIGLINLIYNLARYEQIVRLKLLPRNAV